MQGVQHFSLRSIGNGERRGNFAGNMLQHALELELEGAYLSVLFLQLFGFTPYNTKLWLGLWPSPDLFHPMPIDEKFLRHVETSI